MRFHAIQYYEFHLKFTLRSKVNPVTTNLATLTSLVRNCFNPTALNTLNLWFCQPVVYRGAGSNTGVELAADEGERVDGGGVGAKHQRAERDGRGSGGADGGDFFRRKISFRPDPHGGGLRGAT
jgi:hypothetical protein